MTKRFKAMLVLSLLLALCSGGAFLALSHANLQPNSELVPVRRSHFEVRVDTLGELDTSKAYEVVSEIRGDRAKVIKLVADGTRVKKGDTLVAFDPTYFESEILRLKGELQGRESVLEYAKQMIELERSQAEKASSNARFERDSAEQDYDRYKSYIQDLKGLKRTQGHDFDSEIVQAQRKCDEALLRLNKAEADAQRLEQEATFKLAQVMAQMGKAQGELDTTRQALAALQADFAKTQLQAPADGFAVLHEVYTDHDQKRKLRVGDTVWQGQSVLYLPDLSSMIVKTRVREMDLNKLKPGQAALVRVDAFPDTNFVGQVETVGVLAAGDAGSGGKSFEFAVKIAGLDERLRPGMTARVSIVIDKVQDVLTVPVTALFNENGGSFCYAQSGGKLKLRPVSIGRLNADVAEINSGLAEGDLVSLVKP